MSRDRLIVHAPGLWVGTEPSEAIEGSAGPVRLGGQRGRKLVSAAARAARLANCRACTSHWHGESRFGLGHCGLCRVCGGTRIHAWLWASKCAKGLWTS